MERKKKHAIYVDWNALRFLHCPNQFSRVAFLSSQPRLALFGKFQSIYAFGKRESDRERERERERESVCVCVFERAREKREGKERKRKR